MITSQCNFGQLNCENKLVAGVNWDAVLEFAAFPADLGISPGKPL